jgi:DNA gyrase subunit A
MRLRDDRSRRQKIVDEYEETLKLIERLKAILAERCRLKIVIDELEALKEQFGDERRTEIVAHAGNLDRGPDPGKRGRHHRQPYGYVKRTALSTYRSQRRGGRAGSA